MLSKAKVKAKQSKAPVGSAENRATWRETAKEGREARQQLITQVQEIKICHFLRRFQELSFERWSTFSRHWWKDTAWDQLPSTQLQQSPTWRLEKHRKTTNYFLFQAKTEALALKLRCLELEVLNATYTKDSVAALRKVKKFKSISEWTLCDLIINKLLSVIGIDQS